LDDEEKGNMGNNTNALIARWQKACLAITLIFSASYLVAFFQKRYMLPRGMDGLVPTVIGILVFWSPLIFHRMGLRASSSISASVLGMIYFVGGLFGILTPDFPKLYTLLYLLLAIFYYFYSTKTWHLYEFYWLSGYKTRTAEGRES
jgi:hypothetical protein